MKANTLLYRREGGIDFLIEHLATKHISQMSNYYSKNIVAALI